MESIQKQSSGKMSKESSTSNETGLAVSIPPGARWVHWSKNTGLSTLNSSECPIDVKGSSVSLSSILQTKVDEKFYLTAKAGSAILERSNKKGKMLPPLLQKALESVAGKS